MSSWQERVPLDGDIGFFSFFRSLDQQRIQASWPRSGEARSIILLVKRIVFPWIDSGVGDRSGMAHCVSLRLIAHFGVHAWVFRVLTQICGRKRALI